MAGLKIVTIGGGSSYTPELVEGLIKRYDTLPIEELCLLDIEEGKEKLEIIGSLTKRMFEKAGLPTKVTLSYDRRESLVGADFVITQIRVGQLAAREIDEAIPLEHGILGQETNGAGGLFNGLRAIPVLLEINKDIAEICPEAWMINFSNPAGMVTEACLRYGATPKVVGLCNVPLTVERQMAELLEVNKNRLWIKFAGLNHMSYGLNVYLDGKDYTKEALKTFTEKTMAGMNNIDAANYEAEFINALGAIPSYYHSYYYKTDLKLKEELEAYERKEFRSKIVQKLEKDLFLLYQDESLKEKPPQLEKRGGAYYSDAACDLIDSLYNDKKDIQALIIKNNGAISGLPDNSAVEISAIVTKEGPIPLTIGELPIAINGLIQQMKAFERLAIEAAIEGSRDKAILALSINPLTPSDEIAKVVVDKMVQAQKQWLPNFD